MDSSGARHSHLRYSPWGETRETVGTPPTAHRFTGQALDPTGLYFYHARYYDPALARFLQPDTLIPDPSLPQAFNRFSYVLNNPIKYVDPTGHCAGTDTNRGRDTACWDAYDQATAILGGNFAFLASWSYGALQNLLGWLDMGIRFTGAWDSPSLQVALQGLDYVLTALQGDRGTMQALLGIKQTRHQRHYFTFEICATCWPSTDHITIFGGETTIFNDTHFTLIEFLHEVGHQMDYGLVAQSPGKLSLWSDTGLAGELGWMPSHQFTFRGRGYGPVIGYQYDVNSKQAATRAFVPEDRREDFADTFMVWVLTANQQPLPHKYRLTPERNDALNNAFNQVP